MKTSNRRIMVTLTAVVFLAFGNLSHAGIDYYPGVGGFIGKGDVQAAFGFNNKQLQDNAADITFTYVSTDVYEGTCSFSAGNSGVVQTKSRQITLGVDGTVESVSRKNSQDQVTGFILGAFTEGSEIENGSVPSAGDPCDMAIGNNATWDASPIRLTESMGGLYANLGELSVLLWTEFFDEE